MLKTDPVIRQSGVIPYRIRRGDIEILLVTNSGGTRWVVPKGHVDAGLTPQQSAIKEAFEEAGIIGVPEELPIGSFEYVKRSRRRVVDLYPMEVATVLNSWPERSFRKRRWVPLERAAHLVKHGRLARCMRRLRRYLELEMTADKAA
jgi:8-oxo-dGTP pyrophosphatase MutT (NUDIX family)